MYTVCLNLLLIVSDALEVNHSMYCLYPHVFQIVRNWWSHSKAVWGLILSGHVVPALPGVTISIQLSDADSISFHGSGRSLEGGDGDKMQSVLVVSAGRVGVVIGTRGCGHRELSYKS